MGGTYRLDPDLSGRAADRLHGGFVRAGWAPTDNYDSESRQLYALDQIGAAVWLCLADGLAPSEVVDELTAVFPDEPARRIADDVWDLFSTWAQHGLLTGF